MAPLATLTVPKVPLATVVTRATPERFRAGIVE
jgi:hypothetical protein